MHEHGGSTYATMVFQLLEQHLRHIGYKSLSRLLLSSPVPTRLEAEPHYASSGYRFWKHGRISQPVDSFSVGSSPSPCIVWVCAYPMDGYNAADCQRPVASRGEMAHLLDCVCVLVDVIGILSHRINQDFDSRDGHCAAETSDLVIQRAVEVLLQLCTELWEAVELGFMNPESPFSVLI